MKIVVRILIGLFAIVALALIYAAVTSKTYEMEESIVINVPMSVAQEQATHWDNFQVWSPWSKLDPEMKVTYSGSFGQVGSKYSWEGNKEAGSGSQEITAIEGNKYTIDLHFLEPFESKATTYFDFESADAGTKVTWAMSGEMAWPMNLMKGMLVKSIRKDYQEGLENLKVRCESLPAPKMEEESAGEEVQM
jgi:hypothetical protein